MADLTDRKAFIKWASKIPVHDLSDGRGLCRVIFAEDFLKALKYLPSVDAVEVIRCKDCKHGYETFAGLICSHGVCVDCVVRDDFYCSYGERNNDGFN